MTVEKRPALGRGLSALIPDARFALTEKPTEADADRLVANRHQPRGPMDEGRLDELARSVRTNGVIQPIVVRPMRDDGRYEIIAGERRWRAAQRAGLDRVPIVVRDVPDDKLLQVALIENLQREDLNPIEEASAYRNLIERFNMKQEEVASAVGKDRSSVANYLRLLRLPEEVRAEVAAGTLSMGHARALLVLPDDSRQRQVAREILARGLSVRETETLVRKLTTEKPPGARAKDEATSDVHTRAAEERLRLVLGTRVRIVRRAAGGRIEIDFTSEDELQRIYEHLTHGA